MSRFAGLKGMTAAVALALLVPATSGCIVEEPPPPPPPDTAIGFTPAMNLGQSCGAELTRWEATMRESGETMTGGCSDPLVFDGLAPNASYTFDIDGYSGSELCWQGSCGVSTEYGIVTYADCSQQIAHLCGY